MTTPVTWDEVRGCETAEQLTFTADDVLDRIPIVGDLFAPVEREDGALPS